MFAVKKTLLISYIFSLFLLTSCGNEETDPTLPQGTNIRTFQELDNSSGVSTKLPPINYVRSIPTNKIGYLGQLFNDSNFMQLEAARRLGIEPITDLSSAYFTKRPLVKVSSNEYYQIDSLRHSIPYLVPEAASLLNEIGKNFIDSLYARGGDSYKIKVTSLLRTPVSVGRLRRVNVNATDSSTHQYATTFDISYTNFYCLDENRQINQGDLKNLLGEVLQDLRKKGRCFVKYERKTGCFHVTVNQ